MLLRFRVSNYASIRDEQKFSLIALGPNASGKSNLIKAIEFARDAVRYSHQRWLPGDPIPRWPFHLDDHSRDRPSEFDFDLIVAGVRYAYGFALDDQVIQREWLHAFPKGRRQVYFEREGGSLRFGNNLTGHRQRIAETVRPNSLFLSAGAANHHPQLGPIYQWFGPANAVSANDDNTVWSVRGPVDERTLALVRFADLGILDAQPAPSSPHRGEHGSELLHQVSNPRGHAALPSRWESTGTHAWLYLLGCVVPRLDAGGLLMIDNLDDNLHPLLAARLVRLFHDPATNPHDAQLIFSSHHASLLGRHPGVQLSADQIWLTEKG